MWLPLSVVLLGASPAAVTDITASVRLRVESRDDRFFEQTLWADRDVPGEWRLRGNLGLEKEAFRLDLELQDQRIFASEEGDWLDASPANSPRMRDLEGSISGASGGGLRLAGALSYRTDSWRLSAGRFPAEAAGGLLLGADEYRLGNRPFAMGWTNGKFVNDGVIAPGETVWAGVESWDPVVGATTQFLAKHARENALFHYETGALIRRAPSRPLYSGLWELTATPYITLEQRLTDRLSLETTAAYQFGKRKNRLHSSALQRENVFDDSTLISRSGIYYTGESGDRRVLAPFVHGVLRYRLPIRSDPTLSAGFAGSSGGGTRNRDFNFVPFEFDRHYFFGSAGYFGPRNSRSVFTEIALPLPNGWSARAAAWNVEVASTDEGLFAENGDRFAPDRFTSPRREIASSRSALWEWDAELQWKPKRLPLFLRLEYSEVRHRAYFTQMARNVEPQLRLPPAQWASAQLSYAFLSP